MGALTAACRAAAGATGVAGGAFLARPWRPRARRAMAGGGRRPAGGAPDAEPLAKRLDDAATRVFRAGGRENTTFFRAVNFELFARPTAGQRALAAVGTSVFVGVCVYLGVENYKSWRWQQQRARERAAAELATGKELR